MQCPCLDLNVSDSQRQGCGVGVEAGVEVGRSRQFCLESWVGAGVGKIWLTLHLVVICSGLASPSKVMSEWLVSMDN